MPKKKVLDTALMLYAEKFDIYGAAERFSVSGKTAYMKSFGPGAEEEESTSLPLSRFS